MIKARIPSLLAAILVFTSCSVMCIKKPALTNTVWTAESHMFVADAGTETTTCTLTFHPGKQYTLVTERVLPPHPAMYMNPDGQADIVPGYASEYTEKGTYSYKKGVLVLTSSEGDTKKLIYLDGAFSAGWILGDEPAKFEKTQP